jgi:peroxiredoxin
MPGKLKIGDKGLDFNLPGVDGKKYSLGSFRDKKAVAVIFTCNHCPYAKAYEDRLVAAQRDYASKGVALVAINSNEDKNYPDDSFDNMVKRAKEKGFNFPYLRDETQDTARGYGAERTPEIFLLDSKGTIRYHGTVDDNYDDPSKVKTTYFRNALDALLAGKQVSTPETQPVGCTIKWKK